MKIVFRVFVAAGVLALGFWLWTIIFPSPEKVIRRRLTKVAALLSYDSKEGLIARAANISQLSGYFSPDVVVSVDTPSHSHHEFKGRDELTQRAMAVRTAVRGMKVQFLDLNIALSPDKSEATVDLTGEARVPGDQDLFVQELKFYLHKVAGDWLIVRVETVRTLT